MLSNIEDIDPENLNLPEQKRLRLKFNIISMYIELDNEVIKSEIKVVTYIDLITQVAGVPSFLLIICKFWLKKFENFYSQYQMSKTFKTSSGGDDDKFHAQDNQ